jgi:hypothetical protein
VRGVGKRETRAYDEVDALADEIDRALLETELEPEGRVRGGEARERRNDEQQTEADGRGERELTGERLVGTRTLARASSAARTSVVAWAKNRRPSSVRRWWRVVRSRREAPSSDSRVDIWRLIAASESPRERAAADIEPDSTTRTKDAARPRKSIRRLLSFLQHRVNREPPARRGGVRLLMKA